MNLDLDLPFDHTVEAYYRLSDNRRFVMVSRDHGHTPFVVYRLAPDNRSCAWGTYCETRCEADRVFVERTGLLVQP